MNGKNEYPLLISSSLKLILTQSSADDAGLAGALCQNPMLEIWGNVVGIREWDTIARWGTELSGACKRHNRIHTVPCADFQQACCA